MTDTTTTAPTAGWYADPTEAAPLRWWDGSRWTERTLASAPRPASTPVSAEVEAHAARAGRPASAPMPSRRSLRNLRNVPTGSPTIGPLTPTPYVPLNPLDTAAPTSPESPTWHTPEAWIANAPAAPDYAVYGTGLPFGRTPQKIGPQPDNRPARVAITFVVLSVAANLSVMGLVNAGLLAGTTALFVVVAVRLAALGLMLAAFPIAIAGLVRASRMRRVGHQAKGRTSGVLALIASSLIIALLLIAVVAGFVLGVKQTLLAQALPGVGGAGTSQPLGGFGAGGVPTPVIGTPSAGGLVYSKSQADHAVAAALTGNTGIRAVVACPATVPLSVGSTFSCKARVDGASVVAHVSVLDASGRSALQVATR